MILPLEPAPTRLQIATRLTLPATAIFLGLALALRATLF